MNKLLIFRGPVESVSGYGAHSRDLLQSLYEMNLFDIKIDSSVWGSTPLTALNENDDFHKWIKSNIITFLDRRPDIYVQVTVPNEFKPIGLFNIGITAGIETTIAPKEWVDGCNKMDLIITTSKFSKDVLLSSVYNEVDKNTGKIIKQHRIEKPIIVLFEGVRTEIYNNQYVEFNLDVDTDFCFLFVGHWLKGDIGADRKDVGMLIKTFCETFSDFDDRPSLILKTSSATFSIKERERIRKRIKSITSDFDNPPPIYLLFGELTDHEMNQLYNHPKIKAMVSITKGEGFGRPLLEFSMTGKPIIASNWSGHKDFLPLDKSILIGGKLVNVDESAIDNFILKDSKWFTANYDEFKEAMKLLMKDYDLFLNKSEELRITNIEKFSFVNMVNEFKKIMIEHTMTPIKKNINLPNLIKI